MDEVTLPPMIVSQQTSAVAMAAPPPPGNSSPAVLPVETTHHFDNFSQQTPGGAVNSQADMDLVNFDYLRHVILKFLLSRDSEVSGP